MEENIFNHNLSRDQLDALCEQGVDEINSGNFTLALDHFLMIWDAPNAGPLAIKAIANIAKIFEVLRDIPSAIKYAELADLEFEGAGIPLTDEDRGRNYCLIARLYIMTGQIEKAEEMLRTISPSPVLTDMTEHVLFLRISHEMHYGHMEEANAYIHEYLRRLPSLMQDITKIQGANEVLMYLTATGHIDDASQMIAIMQPVIDQMDIPSYRMMFYQGKLVFDDIVQDPEEKQKDIVVFYNIVQEHMSRTIGGILENVKFNLNARMLEKQQVRMKKENERLLQEAETDPLTGIPNRRALTNALEHFYQMDKDSGKKVAIEIFDIDYFKQLNDRYGHQKGDEALIAVANVLKNMADENTFVFRYGGDEFCVLYANIDRDSLCEKCGMLRKNIIELYIPNEDSKVSPTITISQGVYIFDPSDDIHLWEAMFTADRALYAIKKDDRGGIYISDRLSSISK